MRQNRSTFLILARCVYVVISITMLEPLALIGQSKRGDSVHGKPSLVVTPSTQQIPILVAAHKHALQMGTPEAIEGSARSLAAYLFREMARIALSRGECGKATELYRSSLQLKDLPEARLELASTLLRDGHPSEAESEAGAIVALDSTNALAWTVRGGASRALGHSKEAVDAFTHAVQLTPDINVAYALGSAFLADHEKEKADRIFRQISAASGNAAIWHVAVGDAYREALYLSDAVEEFRKAIAIDPTVGHAEFFLALTYLQMNEWGPSSKSFEHLRAALRLAPREYLSNFYLGALESTDGTDLASSDHHLKVAAAANPSSPEVWLYLGLNAAKEKNSAAAKVYLKKAIDLTGADEARNNYQIRRVYAVLGRILLSEGNRVEGNELLTRYRRTEQLSIGNSAHVIALAAEAGGLGSSLSKVSPDQATYPGMESHAGPEARPESTLPQTCAAATRRTPSQDSEIESSRRTLAGLLAETLNDLGTAEARQEKYKLALGHFLNAEDWQRPTPTLLHNIGVAAFQVKDFGESARSLSLFLHGGSTTPRDPVQDERSRMMLAMSLFSLGRFGEADKEFAAIPSLVSKDSRAAYSWAYSLAHSGKQQQANEIAGMLTQQPLPPETLSLVCHLYMDTESYEQSAACFRKASELDPLLRLAHYQIAESLIRLNRAAEAVPELKQELLLSPDDPDIEYSLAFALLQDSHKSEAIDLLRALTDSHPTHAQAQYQLGKALLEQGQTTDAVKHLELAEQNDPSPDYIHYQLQAAYRKAGRIEEADRELAVFREIKAKNRRLAPSPSN